MNIHIDELFLKLNNKTISSVESITGGLFSHTFTTKPGSSKYFIGGLVTYSNIAKENILNISTKDGVINKKTAIQMAKKGKLLFDSDICISFTGNAGPNSMENQEVGLVYVGIAYKNVIYDYKYISNEKDRLTIIQDVINFGIKKIIEIL